MCVLKYRINDYHPDTQPLTQRKETVQMCVEKLDHLRSFGAEL